MNEFKKSTTNVISGQHSQSKKYESLINKKKDLTKTKHIRTEG